MKPIKNHQFLSPSFVRPMWTFDAENVMKWYNIIKGPELFWDFFPFWYFLLDLLFCPLSLLFAAFWSWKLPFNCLCNILELEPPIFHRICMEIAAFWSWKLPFQQYLHHFWISTSHFRWNLHGNSSILELDAWNLQQFGAGSCRWASRFRWNLQHFVVLVPELFL